MRDAFVNALEVCAQEAAYLITGLSLKVSTRACISISTRRSYDRVGVLKNRGALDELPEDSTDVMKASCFQHYHKRPASMDNVCLADFVAWYTSTKPVQADKDSNPLLNTDGEALEYFDPNGSDQAQSSHLPLRCGRYRKNEWAKVIRYHLPYHNPKVNPTEFMRVMMLLFAPWRDEAVELEVSPSAIKARFLEQPRHSTMLNNLERYNKEKDIDALAAKAKQDAAIEEREELELERQTNQVAHLCATHLFDQSTAPHNAENQETYDINTDITALQMIRPMQLWMSCTIISFPCQH